MQTARISFLSAGMAVLVAAISITAWAQTPTVKSVEIKSNQTSYEVGQHVLFTATAKDERGATVNEKPVRWFAAPFDLAAIDSDGNASFYQPGEVIIGTFVAGKPRFTRIKVNPAPPATVGIAPVSKPLVVGGTYRLSATAYLANGDPRSDVAIAWSSENPEIATVDAAGVVTGKSPGTARIRAKAGAANGSTSISIVNNTITALSVEPASSNVSTGDVVRFRATATGGQADDFSPRWTIGGEGASIDPDGGFVAERPGTYLITASIGERTTTASVVVTPRNAERSITVVGRAELKDVQAAEEWIIGNYAYVSTISDHFLVYDVSDPAHPN